MIYLNSFKYNNLSLIIENKKAKSFNLLFARYVHNTLIKELKKEINSVTTIACFSGFDFYFGTEELSIIKDR